MIEIKEITTIDKKSIALMDTSSVSFMQNLKANGINADDVLKDYDLILIPEWVLREIEDSPGRIQYVQKMIDEGYPIYAIAEETYSRLTDYEEGNLYRIVFESVSMIGSMRSYLRRNVERDDPLEMEEYAAWINKLYDEWPISSEETLSNGRRKKKNAGEISITILAEIFTWYYPDIQTVTVYSQDSDAFNCYKQSEEKLRKLFSSRTPMPVSFKSNDAILCQLFRVGKIDADRIVSLRKDMRRITYSKQKQDHSSFLQTIVADNDKFIELIKDDSVRIIF